MAQYRTYKWDDDGYSVVDAAIQLMQLEVGTYTVNGIPIEVSKSRALELICAEYISGHPAIKEEAG